MSPEVPAPGIAGGEKAKATASGSWVNGVINPRFDFLIELLFPLPFFPRSKRDKHESAVGALDAAEQT